MNVKKLIAKQAAKTVLNKMPEYIDKQNNKIDDKNMSNSLASEFQNVDLEVSESDIEIKKLFVVNKTKLFESKAHYYIQDSSKITHYTAKWAGNSKSPSIVLYDLTEKEIGSTIRNGNKDLYTIHVKKGATFTLEKKFGLSTKYEISEKKWAYDASPGILKIYNEYGNAIFQIRCAFSDNVEKAVIEYTDQQYEIIAILFALSMIAIQNA